MSTTDHTTTVEQAHPNAATIEGLREVAAWLEQHPELPKPYYCSVALRSAYHSANAREELTVLANALGERAMEKPSGIAGEIEIRGLFGPVLVYGSARIQDLRDEPLPVVEYEPILKRGRDA